MHINGIPQNLTLQSLTALNQVSSPGLTVMNLVTGVSTGSNVIFNLVPVPQGNNPAPIGNAVYINHNTNTGFVATGFSNVGASDGQSALKIIGQDSNQNGVTFYASSGANNTITFVTCNSRFDNASAISGDGNLGRMIAVGHDGNQFVGQRAGFIFRAGQDWTTTNTPTYATWELTPPGSTSRTEFIRFSHTGGIGFSPSVPVVVGSKNSSISSNGVDNFLLFGIANSGNFTGVGNFVAGYGNAVNLAESGVGQVPSLNVIVGNQNVLNVTGASNQITIVGDANIWDSNSGNAGFSNIFGAGNIVKINSGVGLNGLNIFGNQNTLTISSGFSIVAGLYGKNNNYINRNSIGNTSRFHTLVGTSNQIIIVSGNALSNDGCYGANNIINMQSFPNGTPMISPPGAFGSANQLFGFNNMVSGTVFTTLFGWGLTSTGSSGSMWGIGGKFLAIDSGRGTVNFQGLNPCYPVGNVTGNFSVTGGQARYVWSGSATWTGTLPTPSLYSGMDAVIKNISTSSFLFISGSVDYGINASIAPTGVLRLYSDSNSWLVI